ncbi:MAG: [LysW]-lysine hydrolase [Anaerolineales bacterium]|nr:[LysW]-lysine hydrolase [Anaerolineales bacterium]
MVEPLQLLQELVSIPSVSGQEGVAAGYLVNRMADLGYRSYIDEAGNAVGVLEQPDSEGRITFEGVLMGHIDTVPGQIPVEIRDGCLYGRGTVDAKGPLAAFVLAAAQTNLAPGTRLIVAGAVEEEAATSKGAWFLVDHLPAQEGEQNSRSPDFCIIGEPSGGDAVTLGYKGRALFDYTWSQEMSHTAGPEQAAAEKAVTWWNEVRAYADSFNKNCRGVFDQLSPSLRFIKTHSNGMCDSVTAKVVVRIPPGVDLDTFEADIRRLAVDAQVCMYSQVPAYRSQRNTPLVRVFSNVLRQNGFLPRLKVKTGTSDMNVVGPRWGCPIVAYGPGDSRLDHTPNEHLEIEKYFQAITTLIQVLEQAQEVQHEFMPVFYH